MSKIALPALALLIASTSFAQARLSTEYMSCAEAAATVASYGAIVMNTGPNTYNRFVVAGDFCLHGEYAKPAYAPTADAAYCPLGYTCEYRDLYQRRR